MNIKKLTKLCLSLILSLVLAIGQFVPAYAYEHEGNSVQGIQIGDTFYSIEYITTHDDDFGNIFGPSDPSTVIIDLNGKSAKFSDYLAGGVSDFDEFASDTANQTQAAPDKLVESNGNVVILSSGGDDDDGGEETGKTVSSAYAVSNTSVEVIFSSALETTDYAKDKFTFTGGLTVESAAIKAGSSNKVVVLTTSAQTGGSEYTLTYDGKAVSEKVTGIAAGTTVPEAPEIPVNPVNDDNKLQGLESGKTYEYQVEGSSTWTTYDSAAGLPESVKGKDILVREKATATTPAGTPVEVSIPSAEEIPGIDRVVKTVTAYNDGSSEDTIRVTFDKPFTTGETASLSEFEVKRTVNGGTSSDRLALSSLEMSSDKSSITVKTKSVGQKLEQQNVVYSVSYKNGEVKSASSPITVDALSSYMKSYSIEAGYISTRKIHVISVETDNAVLYVKVNGEMMNYKGDNNFVKYTTILIGESSADIELYGAKNNLLETRTINVPYH